MKAKHLLFAIFALALGTTACENDYTDVEQPSEPKTYTIKLRTTGEVDVTYEPLTRFTPDDRDLYGVQVWHKPATTGSYEYYAYGLFDNLENTELEVTENYKYRFYVTLIDDGKDKIYKDSILVDNQKYYGYSYPFKAYNNYNASPSLSITKVTNEFVVSDKCYFQNISSSGYSNKNADKETLYWWYSVNNPLEPYYGEVVDYIPEEDGTIIPIYLKKMVTGIKVSIGDWLTEGTVTMAVGTSNNYFKTFTPNDKEYESVIAVCDRQSWYNKTSSTPSYNEDLFFVWTKNDGTQVKWKSLNVYMYRLKQTVVTLDYYQDDIMGANALEMHYEDLPIEENYKIYNFGGEQDDYIF